MSSESNVLKNAISDTELISIVRGLREKTSNEVVAWEERKEPIPDEIVSDSRGLIKTAVFRRIFQLRLPQSVIELEHVRPKAEPDYVIFTLRRKSDSALVAQRQVYEGDFAWEELCGLYAVVHRKLMGWDNVLRDVQTYLNMSSAQPVS